MSPHVYPGLTYMTCLGSGDGGKRAPAPRPQWPSTWHRDLGECFRLAQRVNLDMSEGLAHRALQMPASQDHRLLQRHGGGGEGR